MPKIHARRSFPVANTARRKSSCSGAHMRPEPVPFFRKNSEMRYIYSRSDAQLMPSKCALCGRPSTIRQSHIIPKFATKWIKCTSATGYLVKATDAAVRIQDGTKTQLLCDSCEELFSKSEKYFADKIFYPFHNKGARSFDYNNNLRFFAVSLSWRAMKISYNEAARDQPGFVAAMNDAESCWREFLLEKRQSIEPYESYLIFLDGKSSNGEFHNNKWYTARSVDSTLVIWEDRLFAYSLLPRMAITTSIHPTMLPFCSPPIKSNGKVSTSQHVGDSKFFKAIANRAAQASAYSPGPSIKESERRLKKASEKNPSKVIKSETIKIIMENMDADRRLKMRYKRMPKVIIELVERVILNPNNVYNPGENTVLSLQTRQIAYILASLPKKEAEEMACMIESIISKATKSKNCEEVLIRSGNIWVVFMVCHNAEKTVQQKKILEKIKKLQSQQTYAGTPIAVFSMNVEGCGCSFESGFWMAGAAMG